MGCGNSKDAPANNDKGGEEVQRPPADKAPSPGEDKAPSAGEAGGKKEVIFMLGGPGSGKGTMCAKIAEEFGYVHLSTGDLLREELKTDSADATEAKKFIENGELVPTIIVIRLMLNAFNKPEHANKKFLLDGFPRSQDNLDKWNEECSATCSVNCAMFFECPLDELEKRLLKRGETSGRADDNLETIKKRFNTFQTESVPVVENLKADGTEVYKVEAVGTVDEVWEKTKKCLNHQIIQNKLSLPENE